MRRVDLRRLIDRQAELPSKGSDNPRHVIHVHGRERVMPFNRMASERAPNSKGGESFDWGSLDVADGAIFGLEYQFCSLFHFYM